MSNARQKVRKVRYPGKQREAVAQAMQAAQSSAHPETRLNEVAGLLASRNRPEAKAPPTETPATQAHRELALNALEAQAQALRQRLANDAKTRITGAGIGSLRKLVLLSRQRATKSAADGATYARRLTLALAILDLRTRAIRDAQIADPSLVLRGPDLRVLTLLLTLCDWVEQDRVCALEAESESAPAAPPLAPTQPASIPRAQAAPENAPSRERPATGAVAAAPCPSRVAS